MAAGYNDDEIGSLFELVLSKPNLLSLELHPICFTGQGGARFAVGTLEIASPQRDPGEQ